MDVLVESFRMGGFGMFPTAVFGVALVGVAIAYAFRPGRALVPLLISLGILTMSAGGFGFVTGLIVSATSLGPGSDPRLLEVGFGESLHNVAWALALVMAAALACSVGALRQAQGMKQAAA